MRYTADTLLSLMPSFSALCDVEQGQPLLELLDVIAQQIGVIEENLDQLYDDQFIETCADWVVPYIGGLIGYSNLYGNVPGGVSPRAEVANTIRTRRRKGTPSALEQVTQDVTGRSTHVVEYFQRLGATQYMNHHRPTAAYAPDLRQWEPLERIDTAFDAVQHTIDVRGIEQSGGLYNIPNIGVWLWRLESYPLSKVKPANVDPTRYRFDPLGHDIPLFNRPALETDITHMAEPANVPEPISRRVLHAAMNAHYGEQKSIALYDHGNLIDIGQIVAADLSDAGGGAWAHQPTTHIAVDPVLGRIALPSTNPPTDLLVSFHYGFSSDMAGGEYERAPSFDVTDTAPAPVSAPAQLLPALTAAASGGAVEIDNGLTYTLGAGITVDPGSTFELRAKNEHRPVIELTSELTITGGADSEVALNGLVIAGDVIRIPAAGNTLRRLTLRHCTLIPGRALESDGTPKQPDAPSLIVEATGVTVEIDHCITGGLRIVEGSNLIVSDSIIDATHEDGVAFAGVDGASAGGMLQIIDATVIGKVWSVLTEYVSNTIFLSRLAPADTWKHAVHSERSQTGCVRFSFVPPGSALPRQYHCQPQLEIQNRIDQRERELGTPVPQADADRIAAAVESWLAPRLTSKRYGDPGYGQLHVECPDQIYSGADDESEMGAFHELRQPQRDTNMRIRMDEYVRFGLRAGVRFAT